MIRQFLRRAAMALTVATLVLSQETWALAGTTGGIGGVVTDDSGAPVSGASVKVVSASQAASTSTDATGHFNFLSLAPDTYTVAIEKAGYEPQAYAGVSVFADNQLALSFRLAKKSLVQIAKVTSKPAGDLVKGGVGSDIYNVNAAAITTTASLGGGGNLNNAYSAMASVPGVTVPNGGAGWNQPTYVRGSQSFFTGFEYDGIPVNRAFDNYNSSTESNLGLQELQVYTGGGPASNSSSGTSGFINQVFKTGTYPGYATLGGSLGMPTFYHQAKIEAGGASPDRRFSYYVGVSGYNQQFRFLDNANGGALTNDPVGQYTGQGQFNKATLVGLATECNPLTGADPNPLITNPATPWYSADIGGTQNCDTPENGIFGVPLGLSDRETVANFHFKIPRKNGTQDDIQILGSTSALITQPFDSVNDAGGPGVFTMASYGQVYCNPATGLDVSGVACTPTAGNTAGGKNSNYPNYHDTYAYNLPFGTVVGAPGTVTSNLPGPYLQPSSNQNRAFDAQLPFNLRSTVNNDTGIIKLQYTHQLSGNAFIRAFGYTFFSDWTQAGGPAGYLAYSNALGSAASPNYDLITHTAGGELQLVDQINPQHLVELTGNYTMANVVRVNNQFYKNSIGTSSASHHTGSPIGLVSVNNGAYTCYKSGTGAVIPCASNSEFYDAYNVATSGGTLPGVAAGSPAALANAQWVTLWDGNLTGPDNTVKPKMGFLSLSDQWRPTDKLLINAALRYDDIVYGLNSNVRTSDAFYANAIATSYCINAAGNVYSNPVSPGNPPPATPILVTGACPAGYNHPAFTATSPGSYSIADVSPRLSATYTQSPDTVWRGSIGRFTQPPISASVQYLSASGDNRSVWAATLPLGFDTPFHPIPAQSSTQADLSLERHIKGTDMSFKISPFYNYTVGAQEQSFIGPGFVTQTPVGNFKSTGIELAFTKGDFTKDGLSASASVTYTSAKEQFTNYFGQNQLVAVNTAIAEFNKLAGQNGGSGSKFYCGGVGVAAVSDPACTATTPAITNPYFSYNAQSSLTINGWYPAGDVGLSLASTPGGTTYYDVPWNASLVLNYRKNKLAITPSVQLTQGASYGGPLDVIGVDPRACTVNSGPVATGGSNIVAVSPGTDPYQCDYLTTAGGLTNSSSAASYLYIPNPQTGHFAQPGAFRNPWIVVGNLAVTYEISPKVTASMTVGNLFHTCFGGTKAPWTAAYSPGPNVCGYGSNTFNYVGGYGWNGTGPNDVAANGFTPPAWQLQSYSPRTGSDAGTIPSPLNVFVSFSVKI